MRLIYIGFFLLASTYLVAQDTLREIQVGNSKGLKKSTRLTTNTTLISGKELLKAACCNLAESFETNPTIDVNFADALTGTRQIKMLGLTSPYLLITEENLPTIRGASQVFGLSFIPGTWIESIQITKGAGSVSNGFESISGQINYELLKPANDQPFFFNAYGGADSRIEINTHFNRKIAEKWSTSLFMHANTRLLENDMNRDGFLDNPLAQQLNVLNRWQYSDSDRGWVGFINLRYLKDDKLSGQVGFKPHMHQMTADKWGSEIHTERIDFSFKAGYVFPEMPFQSIGWQNAVSYHQQHAYFGLTDYNIGQKSVYSNLVFNSIINNTMNKFTTGLNYKFDSYDEFLSVALIRGPYDRIDNSIGAYFEYTYDNNDNFSLIAGLRGDISNRLGTFVTPRLHLRYVPWLKGVFRASAGRGKRIANLFVENQSLFASARTFMFLDQGGKAYGLAPEIAWNYGISFNQQFDLFNRPAEAGFDFYHTYFINQAVVDLYASAQQVLLYNLRGKSYASSFQLDFNYEPIKHFAIRSSFKWYDIQTTYFAGQLERPLQPKYRIFANVEYSTHLTNKNSRWKFDYTFNYTGPQKLPITSSNPVADRWQDFASAFATMNAQITRVFSARFEVYAGGENITNYRQADAILGSENPFGNTFDASMVYAPVFGQMFYVGLRFKTN